MYNFISSSLNPSTPEKRSRSLPKEGDQSSLLHSPPEKTPKYRIRKPTEENPVFLPTPSHKAYYKKASRPPTADNYGLSPHRTSLGVSRSQSPFGFGSPSTTTVKSIGNLFPQKSEKVINSNVYDGIKSQTKLFFSRSTAEMPGASSAKERSKAHEGTPMIPMTPMSSTRDYMSAAYSTRDNKFSTPGCSPRKRLVQQAPKMYNTTGIRLKDAMKESLNLLSKARSDKNIERKRSGDKGSLSKKNKKNLEEEVSPALIALEKRMEEEKKVIDSIGNASCEKFYSNLTLYNKFYAEYLQDPDTPFTAQNDLKVDVRTLISEGTLSPDLKRLSVKKRVGSIQKIAKPGVNMKDLNLDDNGIRAIAIKPFIVKNGGSDTGKANKRGSSLGQKNVEWGNNVNVNEGELEERSPENRQWSLFGKDMVAVEDNLKLLEKMNSLMGPKRELSREEQSFFKAVKDGNLVEVQVFLRFNKELAKIRDLRNQTPLHWAIKRNFPEITEELVNRGADIDALDMTGRRPVDLLQGSRKKEIMDILEQKQWELKRKNQAP